MALTKDSTKLYEEYYMGTFDDNSAVDLAALYNEIICMREQSFNNILEKYMKNYTRFSTELYIDELYKLYNSMNDIDYCTEDDSNLSIEYTEEDFELNGFIKSDFVIHEHNSRQAPLHWDLRFKTEFKTSAHSFVLLKHTMPKDNEKLLCKKQPMHPPVWVDLEATDIADGYGAGSITTIDRGTIYYKDKKDSFTFYLMGKVYKDAYHLIKINKYNYLIFRANKSILPSYEERLEEWKHYATTFLQYLNEKLSKSYHRIITGAYKLNSNITDDYVLHLEQYKNDPYMIIMPTITYTKNLKNNISDIVSSYCNINSIEDIMRLLISREVSRKFFTYMVPEEAINNLLKAIEDKDYNDKELGHYNKELYLYEKLYRMFADIYMGHKYYGAYDFERAVIDHINNTIERRKDANNEAKSA